MTAERPQMKLQKLHDKQMSKRLDKMASLLEEQNKLLEAILKVLQTRS